VLRRFHLLPRDERFFDLFNRAANNLLEGARVLYAILESGTEIDRKARHLKDIEHTGDEITHEIFAALNRTFITPLDREDISRLAAALDDVIDWVEETALRLSLFRINDITPLALKLGRVILDQAEQLAKALPLLEESANAEPLVRATREIHRLENEGDDLLAEALAGLYDGVKEVPELIRAIRWGDIYQTLETATDKAEQVAVVLQDIALKNA
jgi:uncharacterized protein Yka (UPF0111/DUF47 family)